MLNAAAKITTSGKRIRVFRRAAPFTVAPFLVKVREALLWRYRTQHVTGAAHRDEEPAMGTQLLAQTMDVDVERAILWIELAREDFGDQLFASDDRSRGFGQAREDLVFDCCQRQHRPVDRYPPRGGFENHRSNRLHGHSLPRPAGQAATGRVLLRQAWRDDHCKLAFLYVVNVW